MFEEKVDITKEIEDAMTKTKSDPCVHYMDSCFTKYIAHQLPSELTTESVLAARQLLFTLLQFKQSEHITMFRVYEEEIKDRKQAKTNNVFIGIAILSAFAGISSCVQGCRNTGEIKTIQSKITPQLPDGSQRAPVKMDMRDPNKAP